MTIALVVIAVALVFRVSPEFQDCEHTRKSHKGDEAIR